jgi:hypothetical protein
VEHVVFFPAPDGSPAFRRVPSLEEAVRLVEHLRNVEGLTSVSVHSLSEVPLAFRAYYRVEVPVEAVVPAQHAAETPAVEAPVAVEAAVAVDPAPAVEPVHEAPALALVEDAPAEDQELVSSNGHVVPGPTSLGFFA